MSEHHNAERLLAVGVNVALEAATAQLARDLASARVRFLVLKGPVLSRWLRPSRPDRYSVDIDVLVHPADHATAESVLNRLGYRPSAATTPLADDAHARTWHQAQGSRRFPVDLHHTIWGARASRDVVWYEFALRAQAVSVGDQQVLVPDRIAALTIVVLHAAHHGRDAVGAVADAQAAWEATSTHAHQESRALAHDVGAGDAYAAGLELVAPGTGHAPADVETRLRAASAPPTAVGLELLGKTDGVRAGAVFLVRKLVPPRDFVRDWTPVARRGTVGLALAYLYRPFWLARWIIPGAIAWVRARRSVKSSSRDA